mmetsp:Transcript_5573/g.11608  ORF Transcript_5573/g.11608 Transcript_5573/m.11608 type:complete len:245 (-) Transcript_5573:1222-1956(-)
MFRCSINRNSKCRSLRIFVFLYHVWNLQFVHTITFHRYAEHPRGITNHGCNSFRRHKIRSSDEISLILTVHIIYNHDQFPSSDGRYGIFNTLASKTIASVCKCIGALKIFDGSSDGGCYCRNDSSWTGRHKTIFVRFNLLRLKDSGCNFGYQHFICESIAKIGMVHSVDFSLQVLSVVFRGFWNHHGNVPRNIDPKGTKTFDFTRIICHESDTFNAQIIQKAWYYSILTTIIWEAKMKVGVNRV